MYKVVAVGKEKEVPWYRGSNFARAQANFAELVGKIYIYADRQFYYRINFPIVKVELRVSMADEPGYVVTQSYSFIEQERSGDVTATQ